MVKAYIYQFDYRFEASVENDYSETDVTLSSYSTLTIPCSILLKTSLGNRYFHALIKVRLMQGSELFLLPGY